MDNERNDVVSVDGDSVSCDSVKQVESRLTLYTQLSALWLANLLAIACLGLSWYTEIVLHARWKPDEWVLLLIAAPYGGAVWQLYVAKRISK